MLIDKSCFTTAATNVTWLKIDKPCFTELMCYNISQESHLVLKFTFLEFKHALNPIHEYLNWSAM